jgi:hypothetical protein
METITYGAKFKAVKGGRVYRVVTGRNGEAVFETMRDGSSRLTAKLINKDGSTGREYKFFSIDEIKEIVG